MSRFDVPHGEPAGFLPLAQAALEALAARPGFLRGRVGRCVDQPTLWVLTTEWTDVGAYRRSLSAYDVKLATAGLYALARPEPSAFEVLAAADDPQPPAPGPGSRAATRPGAPR